MPAVARVLVAAFALAALNACGRGPEAAAPATAPPSTPVASSVPVASSAPVVVPDRACDGFGDEWMDGPVRAATVREDAGPRLSFELGGEGCPGGADCRQPDFLVPGDRVLVAHGGDKWSCALAMGADLQAKAGYLPTPALAFTEVPAPTPGDWFGTWVNGDEDAALDPEASVTHATIEFQETDAGLAAAGTASWLGPVIDEAGNRSIHEGAFDGVFAFSGARASIGDKQDCFVEFKLVGDMLLVRDNGGCGGAGTSFDGRYRRQSEMSEDSP